MKMHFFTGVASSLHPTYFGSASVIAWSLLRIQSLIADDQLPSEEEPGGGVPEAPAADDAVTEASKAT